MEAYKLQLIETAIFLLVFLIVRIGIRRLISKVGEKFSYHSGRVKITNKIVSILLMLVVIIVLMTIWGVKQSEVLIFLSTILTILGVAFFAQWSIISNITSALIIFFNHPIKIGDQLTILDNENAIEGKLSDIGIFFIIIKTKENKKVTIPSNVFMQKMIRKENE